MSVVQRKVTGKKPVQVYKRPHQSRRRLDAEETAILAVVALFQAQERDDISIHALDAELRPTSATGRISDLHTFGMLTTPRDFSGEPIGTKCRLTRQGLDELNENVQGTPVIVEASIGAYRGNGSRISIATGLPTVLGWERHQ